MTGTCTCCGGSKQGEGRGLCVACGLGGALKDTPKSCPWCSHRAYEEDLIQRLKKTPPPPAQGRNQLLIGPGR